MDLRQRSARVRAPAIVSHEACTDTAPVCSLPQVKAFINEDAHLYPNLKVNYVGGDPRIKFYGTEDGKPEEVVNVSGMNRWASELSCHRCWGFTNCLFFRECNAHRMPRCSLYLRRADIQELLRSKGVLTHAELTSQAQPPADEL